MAVLGALGWNVGARPMLRLSHIPSIMGPDQNTDADMSYCDGAVPGCPSLAGKQVAKSAPSRPPALEAVIPARDAEGFLEPCLRGLAAAGVPPERVVVVDDASSDGTATRAAAFGARVIRRPTRGGSATARNAGAAASEAEVILFVDADVVVHTDILPRIRAGLENPAIAAVFGSYDQAPPAPGLVSRYRNLLHHFIHQRAEREAATFWTGCGAVRRGAFDSVGGFVTDPRLAPVEDIDLGIRLRAAGWRIRLDPQLLCTHLKSWSLLNMVQTDLFHRALPWARMLLTHRTFPADLNLGHGQRVAVALSGIALVALLLAPVWPAALWILVAACLGVLVANRSWFAFLARTRGWAFAIAAFPVHLTHHVCGGVGLVLALLERALSLIGGPAGRSRRSTGSSGGTA
jgi:GT2 family glycosyltransferase